MCYSNREEKTVTYPLSNGRDLLLSKDLAKFYQACNNNSTLFKQFESITNQENFLLLAVQLGVERGYTFTISEVEADIESSTASGQGEYFCLPIGCWHKT